MWNPWEEGHDLGRRDLYREDEVPGRLSREGTSDGNLSYSSLVSFSERCVPVAASRGHVLTTVVPSERVPQRQDLPQVRSFVLSPCLLHPVSLTLALRRRSQHPR